MATLDEILLEIESKTSHRHATRLYQSFMAEIKLRIAAVEAHLKAIEEAPEDDEWTFLHAEFCFLQMRMVCELIALASLSAHSNALGTGAAKLLKKYNADEIFTLLEGINPHAYPKPVRRSDQSNHFDGVYEGFLERSELRQTYAACGDGLHRGALKHALAGKRKVYDANMIRRWLPRVKLLLMQHMIVLPAHRMVMIVILGNPGEPVQIVRLAPDPPGDFDFFPPNGGGEATE